MRNKKLIYPLVVAILGISSCSTPLPNGPLYEKINNYSSYEEVVSSELKFYEKFNDEKTFAFKLKMNSDEIESIKYYIGGICYCALENKEKPTRCGSDENCTHLRNRELFIEYYFKDGNIVTLIYKYHTPKSNDSFKWIESDGGNCYRYERNGLFSYIMTDQSDNHICGLKFLHENEDLKEQFCNLIVNSLF